MDKVDRLLSRLEGIEPPEGLPEKVRTNFHRRYRKYQVAQLTVSTVMILTGIWLFAPWILFAAGQVTLPQNGLVLLPSLAGYLDPGFALTGVTQNATTIQAGLSSTIQFPHWLGIASLTTGSLLGLGRLLHSRFV